MKSEDNQNIEQVESTQEDRYAGLEIDGVGGEEVIIESTESSDAAQEVETEEAEEVEEVESADDELTEKPEKDEVEKDAPEAEEAQSKTETPEKKKNSFNERIQTLTHQRDTEKNNRIMMEQELENYKAQAEYYRGIAEQKPLDASDFETYEEFENAKKQREQQIENRPQQFDEGAAKQKVVFESAATRVIEMFENADNKPDDFDSVVMAEDNGVITPDIVVALSVFENADALAYEMSKNKIEGQRIANLPNHLQVKALENLSSKISKPKQVKKAVSKAPPPITNGGGNNGGGKKTVYEASSLEEHKQIRRKNGSGGIQGRF